MKVRHHRRRYGLIAYASILFLSSAVATFFILIIVAPPSNSIKAIDSANVISDPAWFKRIYADGFRLYIMHPTDWGNSCTPWSHTQSQLKMALDAGLKIAVYTRNPLCWQGGILATGPYRSQLQFFALDIEEDPGIPVTRTMVDGIKDMGVRPVIYTSSGVWQQLQKKTTTDFADIPLWESSVTSFDYTHWKADFRSPTPIMYGGWNQPATMRVGVQQQFEYDLHGVKVDLNSFNATFMR